MVAFDYVPVGDPVHVAQVEVGTQYGAAIAPFGPDSYLVVWVDKSVDAGDIKGRFFGTDGLPKSKEFYVNQVTRGAQIGVSVARFGSGKAIVMWYDVPTAKWKSRFITGENAGTAERTEMAKGGLAYQSFPSTYYIAGGFVLKPDGTKKCQQPGVVGKTADEYSIIPGNEKRIFALYSGPPGNIVVEEYNCQGQSTGKKASMPMPNMSHYNGPAYNILRSAQLENGDFLFYENIAFQGCKLAISCSFIYGVAADMSPIYPKTIDTSATEARGAAIATSGSDGIFLVEDYASAFNDTYWQPISSNANPIGEPTSVDSSVGHAVFTERGAASMGDQGAVVYSDDFYGSGGDIYLKRYRKITAGLKLTGTAGDDHLVGSTVFGDSLAGTKGDDTLEGRGGNDVLAGGFGNDRLIGGSGRDRLAGGPGRDTFVFDVPPRVANADTVVDFSIAEGDTIAVAAAAYPGTVRGQPVNFTTTAPTDLSATFIYTPATGWLTFDADGTGPRKPQPVAVFLNKPALTARQFVVE